MPQEERKNFSIEVIEKTYIKQGKACLKCGLPLTYGYIAHHINGNNADDNEENCALLHQRCHESEQWETLKEQREFTLKHIQNVISKALSPEGLAGTALKEIAGLIDKEISLQNQIYGIEHFDLPAKERIEYSEAIARANLDYYEQGYLAGLQKNLEILQEILKKK